MIRLSQSWKATVEPVVTFQEAKIDQQQQHEPEVHQSLHSESYFVIKLS